MFQEFKDLADKKREVNDRDLEALMSDHRRSEIEICKLDHVQVSCGDHEIATATVRIIDPDGRALTDAGNGRRPRGRGLRRNQPDTPGAQHPPGVLRWRYHGGHGRPWRGDHQDSAGTARCTPAGAPQPTS